MSDTENHTPEEATQRCGLVAILGRPNVGKSSLLNRILEKKISITSRRPQTTRHQILGVLTEEETQLVFVDTPGMNIGIKRALNRQMNRTASSALQGVDAVAFVVEAMQWTPGDDIVLELIQKAELPTFLLINKVDKIKNKEQLLPFLADCQKKYPFEAFIPTSARKGSNLPELVKALKGKMPEHPFMFPKDVITDRSETFHIAEIIREKIMRSLGEELPYETTVTLESMELQGKTTHIHGVVWVAREAQKSIVIGDGGERLKQISSQSRKDIEAFLGTSVYLRLWVKVKSQWSNDPKQLASFGYES